MAEPVPPTNLHRTYEPSSEPTPPVSGPLASLEAVFYNWFVYKAPFQLPVGLTDFIVKAGPWITLGIAVISVFYIISVFSVLSFLSVALTRAEAYSYSGAPTAASLWVTLVFFIIQTVIMFVSISMLLKRQRKGWLLLFYVDLINFVYGIVSGLLNGTYGIGSFIWSIISLAIGLYILFQIRRYYTR